jgi:hypothetical protein
MRAFCALTRVAGAEFARRLTCLHRRLDEARARHQLVRLAAQRGALLTDRDASLTPTSSTKREGRRSSIVNRPLMLASVQLASVQLSSCQLTSASECALGSERPRAARSRRARLAASCQSRALLRNTAETVGRCCAGAGTARGARWSCLAFVSRKKSWGVSRQFCSRARRRCGRAPTVGWLGSSRSRAALTPRALGC